jgi:Glycosyl transferase family 2
MAEATDSIASPSLPRLTVITPVWNAREFIAETIASIASQLQPGDEHIVIDDGSTDGTGTMLTALAPSFRLVTQVNVGEIATVNTGAALAQNDIIGIINADDPILPGLMDAVRRAFAADSELAGVYPDWVKIDENGRSLATIKTAEYDYAVLLGMHWCIPGPGAFFRRSALKDGLVRDPRSTGLSDYDFWLRFGRNGAQIRRMPQVLASWRTHVGGTTFQLDGAQLARAKIAVIERLFALPDLPPHVLALKSQALSAAHYHAALLGLRAGNVPTLRHTLRSLALMPYWPSTVTPSQRRSLLHLAYATCQPLSGWLHQRLDPLLPARFRHARVLLQTFGLAHDSAR